ncbi:MAG TPA: GNAT family N-acetyltransferase [Thermoanaerobaculia bacterium]|nr:GNAT family N-acetyltransferase [Thermoanaerobaculia bacterium]
MLLSDTAPEGLRVFYIGGYWRGPNDVVYQMRLGLESTGARVFEYNTDDHPEALDTGGVPYDRGTSGPVWLRWEALREPIERFAPHLIVCNAGGLSFRPEVAARLRREVCLLGIALSDPDVFEPSTRHIAPLFDRFLTNAPECLPRYEALGTRPGLLGVGTNPEFFHPVPPRPEMTCDVLILGRAHPDRIEAVRELIARFDTHVYGEGWEEHGIASRGLIYGDDVLAALSSARITPVFNRTGAGHPLVKVGIFDFPAAGALVATNRFPAVADYFEFDKEIVGFDETADLVEKIRYYLDHPGEAATIRQAGRERVLREHTWKRVWLRLLRDLRFLHFREVTLNDAPLLWRWRVDPRTRFMFLHPEIVPYPDHLAYMRRHFLPGKKDRWYILEAGEQPVGTVALYDFTPDGRYAEWGRLVLAPQLRGRGWGHKTLALLKERASDLGIHRVYSEVLEENHPVVHIHRALGFVETGTREYGGRRFLQLEARLNPEISPETSSET